MFFSCFLEVQKTCFFKKYKKEEKPLVLLSKRVSKSGQKGSFLGQKGVKKGSKKVIFWSFLGHFSCFFGVF